MKALVEYSSEQIDLIKRTICKGATDDEFLMFVGHCQRTGLDPFARQIFSVKRYDSQAKREVLSIQVSIDGFRLIADRTGLYDGQDGPYWCGQDGVWRDIWTKQEPPFAAKIHVFRKGCNRPFVGIAYYRSSVAVTRDGNPNHFWGKMPEHMLAKCAESMALRKAFPQELSGLYTSDEMGGEEQPERNAPKVQPIYHDAQKPQAIANGEQTHDAPAEPVIDRDSVDYLFDLMDRLDQKFSNPNVLRRLSEISGKNIKSADDLTSLTQTQGEKLIAALQESLEKKQAKKAAKEQEMANATS